MIYEVRTYDLRPHRVPEAERRFGEAYESRRKMSELAASFHTEIGPLNQIIQIWPYADLAERNRVCAAVSKAGRWPPEIAELLVSESVDVFEPFEISPEIKPGSLGPFFEIRTYGYLEGDLPKIVKAWEMALPARLEWGPLVTVCHSERQGVHKLLHIWPYRTLDERWELRQKIRATGAWPPLAAARKLGLPEYELLHQENKIAVPAVFSPLQ